MRWSHIIINPPYGSIGGPVTNEAKKHADKTVCLMPLFQYADKGGLKGLYKHIESIRFHLGDVFDDADTPENLCIGVLSPDEVNSNDFQYYWKLSFNDTVRPVLVRNMEFEQRYIMKETRGISESEIDFDTMVVESTRLPDIPHLNSNSGFHGFRCFGDNFGYVVNVLKQKPKKWNLCLGIIDMHTKLAKDNFVKWAYQDNYNTCLSNRMLNGLCMETMSKTTSIAIPQINWENISDHPLWKEGKYDEAVLLAMGLKWDGDVIVENNGFDNIKEDTTK